MKIVTAIAFVLLFSFVKAGSKQDRKESKPTPRQEALNE